MENDLLPKYVCSKLIKRKEKRTYSLRNNEEFNLPNFNKKCTQNSLFYKGVNLYNEFYKKVSN